jgi:hypothetical protein
MTSRADPTRSRTFSALSVLAGFGMAFAASMVLARRASPPALGQPPSPAATTAAPRPADPVAVASSDFGLARHADPIASYTLRASLDPVAHRVHGEGTIVWRNASRAPQRELYLHLYLNAFKNEQTVYLRNNARGFRGDETLADHGWTRVSKLRVPAWDADLWASAEKHTPGDPEDETDIRVPLPREVEPGASITLEVAWDAKLPSVTLRTGYEGSFHMVAQWFPKLARLEPDGRWAHFPFHRFSEFYADYGTYDVTIDAPERFIVAATGRLDRETVSNGRVEQRYVQEDIHDFAFTAWDQFREVTAATADGVTLRCLYPPGYDRDATIALDAARFGLGHFGAAYGRYPYSTLTIVHPPRGAEEAGGMEYPTLITTGGEWFMPETGARSVELVTLHELGHQWFYGLVASNEHAFPFLDEGFNSYAEAEAAEARWPGTSAARLWGGMGISVHTTNRGGAAASEHNEAVAQSAVGFASGADYGTLVYMRTATVLHTLANVYGKDRVRDAIGQYTRRYRFRHPGPEEMLGVMGEALGSEVVETLREALFHRGWVDYAVAEVRSWSDDAPSGIFGDPEKPSEAPAAKVPGGHTGRVLVRRRGTLRFPVDIDLVRGDGTSERVRWDGQGSTHEIAYAGASPLVAVVVDPEHRVLLDDDLLNNASRPALGRPVLGRRVLERGVFAAQMALHFLAP